MILAGITPFVQVDKLPVRETITGFGATLTTTVSAVVHPKSLPTTTMYVVVTVGVATGLAELMSFNEEVPATHK